MGNCTMELFVNFPVAGIDAAITDHFIVFFRNMSDKPLYEFHNRDSFFYILVIFVSVVMESDKVAVVFVNPGCGDDGTPEIAANIFDGCFWVAFVGLGIYVKTFLMLLVTAGFDFFKGRSSQNFHFVKQGSAEGVAQEGIIEVADAAPETIVTISAFRNKTVDMWVPF